jgi:hypothetical protein
MFSRVADPINWYLFFAESRSRPGFLMTALKKKLSTVQPNPMPQKKPPEPHKK